MIDFNKELEFARLADNFIEAFNQKTGMYNRNNLTVEALCKMVLKKFRIQIKYPEEVKN